SRLTPRPAQVIQLNCRIRVEGGLKLRFLERNTYAAEGQSCASYRINSQHWVGYCACPRSRGREGHCEFAPRRGRQEDCRRDRGRLFCRGRREPRTSSRDVRSYPQTTWAFGYLS